jgi:hypothetical protein
MFEQVASAKHFKLTNIKALRKTAGSGFNTGITPLSSYMEKVPNYLSNQMKQKLIMTASGKTMSLMPK